LHSPAAQGNSAQTVLLLLRSKFHYAVAERRYEGRGGSRGEEKSGSELVAGRRVFSDRILCTRKVTTIITTSNVLRPNTTHDLYS